MTEVNHFDYRKSKVTIFLNLIAKDYADFARDNEISEIAQEAIADTLDDAMEPDSQKSALDEFSWIQDPARLLSTGFCELD